MSATVSGFPLDGKGRFLEGGRVVTFAPEQVRRWGYRAVHGSITTVVAELFDGRVLVTEAGRQLDSEGGFNVIRRAADELSALGITAAASEQRPIVIAFGPGALDEEDGAAPAPAVPARFLPVRWPVVRVVARADAIGATAAGLTPAEVAVIGAGRVASGTFAAGGTLDDAVELVRAMWAAQSGRPA